MLLINQSGIKKQSGAVLVIALVLLAVLTLIGVSSMESASVQLKVSSNTQEHEVAFQSAQSVIAFISSEEVGINTDTDWVAPANTKRIDYHSISTTPQIIDFPYSATTGTTGRAVVTRVGCSAGIGDSLEDGKGQKYNFYDAQVTGNNVSGSSTSVQVQGVRYFAAGC